MVNNNNNNSININSRAVKMRINSRSPSFSLLVAFVAFHLMVSVVVDVHGLRNISPDDQCEPGELVFVGFCNLCLCNSKGVPNQICAKSWCPVKTTFPSKSILNPSTSTPFT
ncbi:uncharacterized protein LOC112692423 [Sipha flava]|uniref:Uncharacterized protein LOC112692423 n=1 Tax=Sipha flava TaxID=143950 RepID=A0A8B8GIY3_9HEMI|nr:uncharacterized protein LOC112692423 [Sipha flava]